MAMLSGGHSCAPRANLTRLIDAFHTRSLLFRVPLTASSFGDERLQAVEIRRAGRDLVTDHETRCTSDAQRFGEFHVLFYGALDGRILHVSLHALDIEADAGGNFEHLGLVDWPAYLIKG